MSRRGKGKGGVGKLNPALLNYFRDLERRGQTQSASLLPKKNPSVQPKSATSVDTLRSPVSCYKPPNTPHTVSTHDCHNVKEVFPSHTEALSPASVETANGSLTAQRGGASANTTSILQQRIDSGVMYGVVSPPPLTSSTRSGQLERESKMTDSGFISEFAEDLVSSTEMEVASPVRLEEGHKYGNFDRIEEEGEGEGETEAEVEGEAAEAAGEEEEREGETTEAPLEAWDEARVS